MGEHDFRVNLDKAQRDEMLEWLQAEIELIEYGVGLHGRNPKDTWLADVRILKSLKAMVENYPELPPSNPEDYHAWLQAKWDTDGIYVEKKMTDKEENNEQNPEG